MGEAMSEQKTAHEVLADIQHQMRAPKNKNNDFGGYKYRNAEGIIAAFKGLGIEGVALICSDTMQEVAGHIFVTATARLTIGAETLEAQGHAMHPLQKKGMDASQITGSASSYARKYALCGLFAIEDETQDPDSRDNRQETGRGASKADKPRDPVAIADALCQQISTIVTLDQANAYPGKSGKAFSAWEWLKANSPEQFARCEVALASKKDELAEAPF
jgi:hypothetical protein